MVAVLAATGAAALVVIAWRVQVGRRRVRTSTLPVRAVLTALDLQRRPPHDARPGVTNLRATLRSARRPAPPRRLPFVTIKRTNPRFGNLGHWWIEVDGVESYGWWPRRCPVRLRDFVLGTGGALNGGTGSCTGGSASRDPHHGDAAQHQFHPVLTVRKSDRRVRAEIRAFASAFDDGWRWSTKRETDDCRTFQVRLMEAVGLVEPLEQVTTRGRGCPFLALFRRRTRQLA